MPNKANLALRPPQGAEVNDIISKQSHWPSILSLHPISCSVAKLQQVNPLDSKGNYSATSNNTKLVHWPLMDGLLHLVQRGRAWADCGPAKSPHRCTKYNSPPINGHCIYQSLYCCMMVRWSAILMWRLKC